MAKRAGHKVCVWCGKKRRRTAFYYGGIWKGKEKEQPCKDCFTREMRRNRYRILTNRGFTPEQIAQMEIEVDEAVSRERARSSPRPHQ